MDVSALISSAVYTQQSSTANQRQIAVAANANRVEQQTVAVLLQAIEQSASYGASGQVSSGAVAGTRFSASA